MSSTKNMKYMPSSKKSEADSSKQLPDMPASVYEAAGEIADAVQLVIDEAKIMHSAKRARDAVFSDDEDVSDLRPDAKPFIPKEDPRYKTAMCFNKACPHGDKCTFAHSEDELRKRMCRFGSRCRNVKKCGESWENAERAAVCTAYHPEETLANHIYREKDFKSREKQIPRARPVLGAFMPRDQRSAKERISYIKETYDRLGLEWDSGSDCHITEGEDSKSDLEPENMYKEILKLRDEVRNLKIEVATIRRALNQ